MQTIIYTLIDLDNIAIEPLDASFFKTKNIKIDVLRLDKIHPEISGNKWFKLRYYLEEASKENKKLIVTRGGAWSNHILATAVACRLKGFSSIGIIRGEEPQQLSYTLNRASASGMRFYFVSREEFGSGFVPRELKSGDYYYIPEGGYGIKGAQGAATMLDDIDKNEYSHICCAAGTGTMTAGLAMTGKATIISVSVLKNNLALEKDITQLGVPTDNIIFDHDHHFGGYAKHQPELIRFMNDLYKETNIPTDFVYTGKLFFAISELVQQNFFSARSRLLLIHSGGLQGNHSLSKRTLIF